MFTKMWSMTIKEIKSEISSDCISMSSEFVGTIGKDSIITKGDHQK